MSAPVDVEAFDGRTPGEWRTTDSGFGVIAGDAETWTHLICSTAVNAAQRADSRNTVNARLIAAAPALLAEVRALRAQLAQAEAEREKAFAQLVSSAAGVPCTVHTEFAPGCQRCIYTRLQQAESALAHEKAAVEMAASHAHALESALVEKEAEVDHWKGRALTFRKRLELVSPQVARVRVLEEALRKIEDPDQTPIRNSKPDAMYVLEATLKVLNGCRAIARAALNPPGPPGSETKAFPCIRCGVDHPRAGCPNNPEGCGVEARYREPAPSGPAREEPSHEESPEPPSAERKITDHEFVVCPNPIYRAFHPFCHRQDSHGKECGEPASSHASTSEGRG